MTRPQLTPPVLVLGGSENALSVARSLGECGITVHALTYPGEPVRHSRFATWARISDGEAAVPGGWERFLLSRDSDYLRGAVLLCCSDEAIEILIRRHEALREKFVLEEGDPAVRLRLLDKLRTYEIARQTGVDTPAFWYPRSEEELGRWLETAAPRFPVILKPLLSYEFKRAYGQKFLRAADEPTLRRRFAEVRARGLDVVLMELIPGPDDRLCSYYTYVDGEGTPLFHFTKRVIRRSPVNMGGACYHVTDWIPEARDLGLRFFRGAGLRGLGNVEFKRDERDGRLKLIECNARFTAANCLLRSSGLDVAVLVYSQLTGGRVVPPPLYRTGLHLWNPLKDAQSFLELYRRGETTVASWARSLLHPQTFPYFSWSDPQPSLRRWWQTLRARTVPAASAPPAAPPALGPDEATSSATGARRRAS